MSRFEAVQQAANSHQDSKVRDPLTISMTCARPKVAEPLDASSSMYDDTTSVIVIVVVVEVHALAHHLKSLPLYVFWRSDMIGVLRRIASTIQIDYARRLLTIRAAASPA